MTVSALPEQIPELSTRGPMLAEYGALKQEAALQQLFLDESLTGRGVDGLGSAFSSYLGMPVVLEQTIVAPHRRTFPVGHSVEDHSATVAWPIEGRGETLGRIVVVGASGAGGLNRTLEIAAGSLARELLAERDRQELEWRLGDELLDEVLRRGPGRIDRMLQARARRLGIELDGSYRVLAVEASGMDVDVDVLREATRRAASRGGRPLALTTLGDQRALMLVPTALDGSVDTLLHAVCGSAEGYCVGLSSRRTDLHDAVTEAISCVRFATASPATHPIVRADALGTVSFLLGLNDPAPIERFIEAVLGRLLRDPRADRSQLVETLRAYLDVGGRHPAVAERCYIHSSTVKDRMRRIGEILELPLSDPQVRFELRLAFALKDALCVLGLAEQPQSE